MRENVDYFNDVWYQEALLKLSLTNLQIEFWINISGL